MGPSEASVHCSTGEQTGKVLQTQWCSAPLTVFKSHPRSESSPDPGSAHSTCGEENKLPKQTNTNFELFTTCQGGLWELVPFSNPIIRSGTGMRSQKWEEGSCVFKLHAERSKREEPRAAPPDPATGNICPPKPLNYPFSGLCLLYQHSEMGLFMPALTQALKSISESLC